MVHQGTATLLTIRPQPRCHLLQEAFPASLSGWTRPSPGPFSHHCSRSPSGREASKCTQEVGHSSIPVLTAPSYREGVQVQVRPLLLEALLPSPSNHTLRPCL